MNNRIRAALLAAITLVALAGCNTMSGAGKDIERGGEKSRRRRSSSTSAGARCRSGKSARQARERAFHASRHPDAVRHRAGRRRFFQTQCTIRSR